MKICNINTGGKSNESADTANSIIDNISHFRLEPFINIAENRIVGFEVLSSLKAEQLPEHWFSEQRSRDLIDFIKFQLEHVSKLHLMETCFYNLSVEGIIKLKMSDMLFISNFNNIAIEISDAYNIKHCSAVERSVFLNNIKLLREVVIQVWLDDFTFDDLHYLEFYHGHIDGIKIDRNEIRMSWFRNEISIILGVLEDIDILIEGVESEEDLIVVKKTGVWLAQGYFWNEENLMLNIVN
ncbi:EAL domain-containing protein [Serratia grimesii]|uniref:EAL domain-containing protein n=1 Tax=Serratia grimesii TaxID=82995 RepID=UPI0039AFFF38